MFDWRQPVYIFFTILTEPVETQLVEKFKGAFFMRHPVRIHILQRQRLVPGYRRHAGHHIQSAEHHSLPERGFNHQDEEFGWD